MRIFLKIVVGSLLFFTVFSFVIGFSFAIYVNQKIEKTIDEKLFTVVGSESVTTLFYYERDNEGNVSDAIELKEEILYGGYRSVYVEYEKIPSDLVNAFVSIEDKRFYSHNGVDWKRTVSAGLNYFLNFSDSFGGSTITQQLVKNVTDRDEYSFQRKIQEIFWALDLETKMDKQEIMGLYLNIINLSQGCYGVQAAAEYYFSKDVSELTLNECACIAAITNNPSYYDPIRNPEHNTKRKNLILREMYNQGYIGEEDYTACIEEAIALKINTKYVSSDIHSWYVDMVIEDVISDLMVQYGYSRAMANLVLYTGGLRIYTAMDPEIQKILETYYANLKNFGDYRDGEYPQSSMIIIDPYSGDILGVVGAVGEKNANRIQNFATQTLRPAGSVIKPLSVFAPAMDCGLITWSSVYDDVPVDFGTYNLDASKGQVIQPIAWPKNSNGKYRGLTNINYAVENSVNTVSVRVLQDLGVEKSFDFLYRKLHMKSLIDSSYTDSGKYITDMDLAALALGQLNYGVSVKEITAAYSIFVNSGIYNHPRSYYKVTDSLGSIVLERQYRGEAVIKGDTAAIMSKMLENVVQNGTAKSVQLKKSVSCAGKTGTTQNNYDRWFVGYTPYYIGGVWSGYEYPKALSGSNRCIQIWDEIMTSIHSLKKTDEEAAKKFSDGINVVEAEYCMDSGQLMTEACRSDPRGDRGEVGFFFEGSEPCEYCTRHVPVAYDKVEGGVVLENECPAENVSYVGLIAIKREFPIEVTVSDAQYVWINIDASVLPETSPTLPFFQNALKEGVYCGRSNVEFPYNRFCRAHFDYMDWHENKRKKPIG